MARKHLNYILNLSGPNEGLTPDAEEGMGKPKTIDYIMCPSCWQKTCRSIDYHRVPTVPACELDYSLASRSTNAFKRVIYYDSVPLIPGQ